MGWADDNPDTDIMWFIQIDEDWWPAVWNTSHGEKENGWETGR